MDYTQVGVLRYGICSVAEVVLYYPQNGEDDADVPDEFIAVNSAKTKPIRVTFRSATQPDGHADLTWLKLSPAERLRRSWRLRRRLPHPEHVHDEKLFPRP